MKKVLIFMIALFSFTTITSADNSIWDCFFPISVSINNRLYWWEESNQNDEIVANLAKAMPKEAIEKAVNHLKAYCCDINYLDNASCWQTNNNEIYPQSIYLFDHILDVYLRRLDAKQKNDNWEDLLYGLEPDEMWAEWRNFIIERWNDVKWSLPLEIKDKFSSMRKLSARITNFLGDNETNINNWKNSFEENIINYDNRTLWDKYNLACDVTKYISERKLLLSTSKLSTSEYNSCKKLTEARINNEVVYTQVLLMQKGNKLLWSNMKSYLSTYFISTKLMALQEKVFNMATSFAEVNNAVWQLIPECSS